VCERVNVALTPSRQLSEVRGGGFRRPRLLTPCSTPGGSRSFLPPPPGLVSAPLRDAFRDAYDEWLQAQFADGLALVDRPDGVALVAVGGLGRGELAPHSDLDLVLLHDGHTSGVAKLADSLWYPIWDGRVGLDHSVRTAAEAVDVARGDLKALLGLLDIRHVAGSEELTAWLRTTILDLWRTTATKRVKELRELSVERWDYSGEGAFLLEPDLKESRGGLRDVQALHALALAQLVDLPPSVRSANGALLDVRGELHRHVGKAIDVFRLQEHDPVALALGLRDEAGDPDRDGVLRQVNLAARTVSHALDLAWRRVDTETASRPRLKRLFGSSNPGPLREGVARDVVVQDGEVVLARDATPPIDPGLLVRVARAAAENDNPIGSFTLDRLSAQLGEVPDPWTDEMRMDFVSLLGTGQPAVRVLDSLDVWGLLERLIPEWENVRCKAQHNPVHRFTVDRHLTETAAQAASLTRDVDRPDLLLVGSLLHDIGKGYPGDHSVVGAVHARAIAERMGFPPADVAMIVAMVRHHLLLPDTAMRRDLDDPRTIGIVSDAVADTADVLGLLHALAIADAAATGPAAWSDWKGNLVAELVRRARGALQGTPLPPTPRLDPELEAMADAGTLAVVVRDSEVLIAAPDSVGMLYRSAGVLALHSMDVRAATILTHNGMAANSYVVTPRFGRLPDPALLRADLARAMEGQLGLADKLRDKEATYSSAAAAAPRPPTVKWFDDEATDATILEIRAEDRIGLLCRLTAAIERSGLNVQSARVASMGGSVVDSFYVTTRQGALVPTSMRADVETELRKA
jgi:[protein-PII] uridylyltransferase